MSKEGHIKSIIEDYLNLEDSLKGELKEKEEAELRYKHLIKIKEQQSAGNTYNIHAAAPIITAFEEAKDIDKKIIEINHKLIERGEQIKEWIGALGGAKLHIRFEFDDLDHRAGDHTFFIKDGVLESIHQPVS
jgi:hypothetical protein